MDPDLLVPEASVGRSGEFPGFLFYRASLRWQRTMTAALRPFGLTPVQWTLLTDAWLLGIDGEAPSQRELAEYQGADTVMTGQVLATLEKRGLVVRARDATDKRVRRVSVTPEGADLGRRSFAVAVRADREFFSQIEDLDSMMPLLRELAAWDE